MALAKIKEVIGTGVYVPGDDIDTDRIIPARFMKCITFDGLGDYLFYDVRFDDQGEPREHSLNDPAFQKASILISGSNFGCGSSREHAPQSIYRAGFRAVVAGNFAEIFFGNSINLGIPCVSLGERERSSLVGLIESDPNLNLTVDVADLKIRAGDSIFPIELRSGARDSLLNGTWDPLEELLASSSGIEEVSNQISYV